MMQTTFVLIVVISLSGRAVSQSSFRCPTGRYIPWSYVCNGRWDCSDGSDERNCQNTYRPEHTTETNVATTYTMPETTPYDPCSQIPCQYGGTCIRTNSYYWPYTGYRCNCPYYRTGQKCEFDAYGYQTTSEKEITTATAEATTYDPCSQNPCQYGGTCIRTSHYYWPYTGYRCNCPYYRTGQKCEYGAYGYRETTTANRITTEMPEGTTYDPCSQNPCQYGGTCIRTNSYYWPYTGYRCNCPYYRTGQKCEYSAYDATPTTVAPEATTYDPCYNNPCQNGGTCHPKTIPYWPYQFKKYICQCDSNHYGQECQHNALGCQNGGYIDETYYNGRCSCPVGTWGYLCQYESDQFTGKKIRLVGFMIRNIGRVEVYHDGQWGTVCGDGFGNTEAEVVCRLLGYSPYNARVFESDWSDHHTYGRIWLDDLRCRGKESSIFDCSHRGLGVHDCYHRQDAGVACHNDTGLSATAIPDPCSPSPCQNGGTCVRASILLSSYSEYKCVCPLQRFGENCEQRYIPEPCDSNPCQYGSCVSTSSTGYRCDCPFDRTGEKCENRILGNNSCSSNPCYNGGQCYVYENAYFCKCPLGRYGKRCESNEFPVRLVGGRSNREGRVEIELNGRWGTVCDDGFDDNAARVICRSLGFGDRYAKAHQSACYGQGIGWIFLDDVKCTGDENSLSACSHRIHGSHDCGHSEDAGVSCGYSYTRRCPGDSQNATIEVPGNTSSSYDPCFSYPCLNGGKCVTHRSYDWPYVDYNCKCPEPRYEGKRCEYKNPPDPCTSNPCYYGSTCVPQRASYRPYDYVDYNCTCPWHRYGKRCEYYGQQATENPTNEMTTAYDPCYLNPCQYGGTCIRTNSYYWPYTGYRCNCPYYRTGQKCEYSAYGYQETTATEGITTTAPESTTYDPCSLNPCQYGGTCIRTNSYYWPYTGYRCNCPYYRTGQKCEYSANGYQTTEILSVTTEEYVTVPVRLVGGNSNREGRVEVYHNGRWGTVCDDHFDDRDATVICRMLGYGDQNVEGYEGACFGAGSGQIWLDDLGCRGTETYISQCYHLGWGQHNCGHGEDVSVSCGSPYQSSCRKVPHYLNATSEPPMTTRSYDPCSSYPCYYGGTCVPQRSYYWPYDYVDYNCTCPWARYGKRCEYYGWPTTESPTNESVQPICKAQADIIFILDGSGSVNAPDFAKQLQFIKSLVRKFDIGPNAVQVGVLQYSDYAVQELNLNTHSTEAAILAAVDRIRQMGDGTNTALALSTARTSSFTAARGDRPNVPNLVIIMTDGRSNDMAATAREANKLRNIASVFAIGVGSNVNTAELKAMATDPDSKFVFTVTDFSALSNIETQLATDACAQATAAPPVNPNVSVNCDSTKGMTVTVDVNDIQSRLGPMTLTLDDIKCVPDQYLGGNAIFHVTLATQMCGTRRLETRDTFIYRNALILRPYSNFLINRQLHYRYTVECVLSRYGSVGEEFVAEGTVYGNLVYVANGNFTLRMDLYHSDYFTYPVTSYPHVVRLNQDMYVDVALLTLDVNLKVVLQNCVATPKAAKGYPQYALISNKCPDDPTVRFYPSNDTHAQFAVKAFEFFNDPEVYIHCDVIVCNATDRDSRCLRPSEGYACPQNGGRGKRAVPGDVEVYSLVQGPVFVQKENPVAEFAVKDERKNKEDGEEGAQAPAATTLGAGVMAVSACVVVIAAVIVTRKRRSSNTDYIPVRTDEI